MESVLDRFRPPNEWYLHDPNGIHGLGHTARVLVWTEHVADAIESSGLNLDREVVRCAAMVHDVRRWDDGKDPEHGARAAAWIIESSFVLPLTLTQAQLESVRYCCQWHVPPDSSCPDMTTELQCLKDADALDRVRIYDLDPTRLRTEAAKSLVPQAQLLLDKSLHGEGDPWPRVRQAAIQMAAWR